MSIKIYWGSNGSYKSASAVEYDIIPELLKGRVVITNIRGCTLEKCCEQYPEIPATADLIYIDTAKAGSLEKLQTWFRWAPQGALIVLDEVQLIHKAAWREKDLEKFILQVEDSNGKRPATFDEAERLGQPHDMLDAFTRHRHFNWDLVLTTPNIKYIRSDIRNTCEVAYRQANGALLGFKGRFKRSMHDADDNKPTQGALTQTLKINQKTFKCYDSTATGKAQDTRAGTNIFKSPRLLMALACSVGAFIYSFSNGGLGYLANYTDKDAIAAANNTSSKAGDQVAGQVSQVRGNANSRVPVDGVPVQSAGDSSSQLISDDLFKQFDASLTYFEGYGKAYEYFLVEFDKWGENGQPFSIDSGQFLKMGYRFKVLTDCAVLLYTADSSRVITCWKPRPKERKDDKDNWSDAAKAP